MLGRRYNQQPYLDPMIPAPCHGRLPPAMSSSDEPLTVQLGANRPSADTLVSLWFGWPKAFGDTYSVYSVEAILKADGTLRTLSNVEKSKFDQVKTQSSMVMAPIGIEELDYSTASQEWLLSYEQQTQATYHDWKNLPERQLTQDEYKLISDGFWKASDMKTLTERYGVAPVMSTNYDKFIPEKYRTFQRKLHSTFTAGAAATFFMRGISTDGATLVPVNFVFVTADGKISHKAELDLMLRYDGKFRLLTVDEWYATRPDSVAHKSAINSILNKVVREGDGTDYIGNALGLSQDMRREKYRADRNLNVQKLTDGNYKEIFTILWGETDAKLKRYCQTYMYGSIVMSREYTQFIPEKYRGSDWSSWSSR